MAVLLRATIFGTDDADRRCRPSDFVVAISEATAAKLDLREAKSVMLEVVRPPLIAVPRVSAALRIAPDLHDDSATQAPHIRIDQTLRTALGIEHSDQPIKAVGVPMQLTAVRLDRWQTFRKFGQWAFGVKHVLARVEKPHPNDIEKQICRLPKDALTMLGTEEGRRVVVCSCRPAVLGSARRGVVVEHSIRALDLSKDLRDTRELEKLKPDQTAQGWHARYVHPGKLLKVDPDLTTIWLDQHERDALGVRPGDAVHVRRDLWSLFKSQAFEFGVVTGLSTQLSKLLPEEWRECRFGLWLTVSAGMVALSALFVVWVRLRARVR